MMEGKGFRELLLGNPEIRNKVKSARLLPSGFQRIGDIVILNLRKEVDSLDKEIGKVVLEQFPYVRSVYKKVGKIKGELRLPEVRYVVGKRNPVTVHKENKCLFKIDVEKLMFAKGNLNERGRLAGIVRSGETVVDMFAGIGYFSIPIAKANPRCRIIAIEKNSEAVKFLKENCILNRISNIEIIEADCMDVPLSNIADRVIMGYFPETEKFLNSAFSFLKTRGIVHYHNIYREKELWEKPLNELRKAAEKSRYKLKRVLYKAKVKTYAPKVWHVMVDGEFIS